MYLYTKRETEVDDQQGGVNYTPSLQWGKKLKYRAMYLNTFSTFFRTFIVGEFWFSSYNNIRSDKKFD